MSAQRRGNVQRSPTPAPPASPRLRLGAVSRREPVAPHGADGRRPEVCQALARLHAQRTRQPAALPERPADAQLTDAPEPAALAELRCVIAAALEDGLLRYSRRREILALARQRGVPEFQTQLLIAQVQFGDRMIPFPPVPLDEAGHPRREAAGPRAAAGGWAAGALLGAGLFLGLLHWLTPPA